MREPVTLFYDGELHDKVWVNLQGRSSRGFPKKSYDIDFHPGHNSKWAPGPPGGDDINLMTTYRDKAQMRNILAYETYRDADCPYHWVFPVRAQQNGTFWGTAHFMGNGDEDWLQEPGRSVARRSLHGRPTGFIAFDGPFLELKFPLSDLGMNPESSLHIKAGQRRRLTNFNRFSARVFEKKSVMKRSVSVLATSAICHEMNRRILAFWIVSTIRSGNRG